MNILITGPESTGKTTLANAMLNHFDLTLIPEFARTYLEERGPKYNYHDLKRIAEGHIASYETIKKKEVVVFDTFLLNLKIWSEWKFGECHPYIEKNLWRIPIDKVFLMYPDIPWVYDPLRESRGKRKLIFQDFQEALDNKGLPYSIIKGTGINRINSCLEDIGAIL